MAIKQIMSLRKQDGTTFPLLHEWIEATLPPDEVPKFYAAADRHNTFVNSKIVSQDGKAGEIIFEDEASLQAYDPKQGDMEFLHYWYRYCKENAITVSTVETTI